MIKSFVAFLVVLIAVNVSIVESFHKNFFNAIEKLEKVSEKNVIQSWLEKDLDRGLILNKEGKKVLENIILKLPCGWPEYGIPPLAPYTNEEINLNFKIYAISTLMKLIRFRVDGLDIMLINKLKISYTFGKKVKYNITFPKIILAGKIDADISLSRMLEYGISIRYVGEGNFEMVLEDITVDGSFKYKAPLMFGSVKIYDFISVISMPTIVSNIKFNGLLDKINELLNKQIEDYLWRIVNYNQNKISDMIEETLVPIINKKMEGQTIWNLIAKIGEINRICYPPPIPWDLSVK